LRKERIRTLRRKKHEEAFDDGIAQAMIHTVRCFGPVSRFSPDDLEEVDLSKLCASVTGIEEGTFLPSLRDAFTSIRYKNSVNDLNDDEKRGIHNCYNNMKKVNQRFR